MGYGFQHLPIRYLDELPPCHFCLQEIIEDSKGRFPFPGAVVAVEDPPVAQYSGPTRNVGPNGPRWAPMCEEHFAKYGEPSLSYRLVEHQDHG